MLQSTNLRGQKVVKQTHSHTESIHQPHQLLFTRGMRLLLRDHVIHSNRVLQTRL